MWRRVNYTCTPSYQHKPPLWVLLWVQALADLLDSVRVAVDNILCRVARDPRYWPHVRPGRWRSSHKAFLASERHPGWRYEYLNGHATVYPNATALGISVGLQSLPEKRTPWTIEAASGVEDRGLIDLFIASYGGSAALLGAARDELIDIATGAVSLWRSVGLMKASVACRGPLGTADVAGAALIIPMEAGDVDALYQEREAQEPYIHLLMVHPVLQGEGMASAMLRRTCTRLRQAGHHTLLSAYRLCDDRARRWYHRHEFTEKPSLLAALHLAARAERLWAEAESSAPRRHRKEEMDVLRAMSRGKYG